MNTRLHWIKSTLRNNYVGAIIVAMLSVYAINIFVAAVVAPLKVAVTASLAKSASVLGDFRTTQPEYPQTSFYLGELVHAMLLLGIAVLVARWIYAPSAPEIAEEAVEDAGETA